MQQCPWNYCCGEQPIYKDDGKTLVRFTFNSNWNENFAEDIGTFTYDLEGRITSAKVGSKTESYTYDGAGRAAGSSRSTARFAAYPTTRCLGRAHTRVRTGSMTQIRGFRALQV
jgi:YD repeat-containing protein